METGADKWRAFLYAIGIHLLCVGLMFVGLLWTHTTQPISVAGGVVEREASIHISNVNVLNPASGKGERVGFKVLEDGRKLRVFRSSGEAIDA